MPECSIKKLVEDMTDIHRRLFEMIVKCVDEADALAILSNISDEFGGESIYFQKDGLYETEVRNRRICEEYDGFNIRDLAVQYNLTAPSIRRIISKAKQMKIHDSHSGDIENGIFDER